jgi:Cu(I)/Ag(I) efflux system protein CusF
MKHLKIAVIVVATFAAPGYAQQNPTDHAAHHVAPKNEAALTDGEVRKIDKNAKKITLRHGPIQNLDMPGMTMVFQVKEAALLDKLKTGEKVKFRAEKEGGDYIVTKIEPAK